MPFRAFACAAWIVASYATPALADSPAAVQDQWELFRWIGAFFAFVGLAFPYIGAGACYLVAPVAPTTYLELDLAGVYELGDESANPYVKAGLGMVGYLHPASDRPNGGIGPTVGFGARLRRLDVSAHLTWLPRYLHGEDPGEQTNVVIGGLTVGITH
jgi:hypothetical protein